MAHFCIWIRRINISAEQMEVFLTVSIELNDLFNKTIIHLLPRVIVFPFVENPISHSYWVCVNVQYILVIVVQFHNNRTCSHLMHKCVSRRPSPPLSGSLIKRISISIAQRSQLHFEFDHVKVRIPDRLCLLPLWLETLRPGIGILSQCLTQ